MTTDNHPGNRVLLSSSARQLLMLSAGITLLAAAILRNAWAGDDSYIIFRSIEQLFAGHGPRWNLVDRVQAYTSPLWFWMLCVPRVFSKDVYLNVISVSLLLDIATIFLLYCWWRNAALWLFGLLLLASSNAFMDYTTSGLEYPLVYLLCTVFFSRYFLYCSRPDDSKLLQLSVVGGLLLVTRHDLLLTIFLPVLHCLVSGRKSGMSIGKMIMAVCVMLAPLSVWTLFSLVYYGVPFPNTAYAKLGMDVPRLQVFEQGAAYFLDGVKNDFISILLMVLAVVAGVCSVRTPCRVMAATIALILFYILWVGGDFMAGRFYAHVVLMAVLLLIVLIADGSKVPAGKHVSLLVFAVFFYAAFYDHTPLNTPNIFRHDHVKHFISDERGFYSGDTSVWVYVDRKTPYFPYSPFYEAARHYGADGKNIHREGGIGYTGYGAPLDAYIDDVYVLADMLRARLPRVGDFWVIGHTPRYYPPGYPDIWIAQGRMWTPDSYLTEYMQVVAMLTQDRDLFSWQRLRAIVKFNLGGYEYLLEQADMPHPLKANAYNDGCHHSWRNAPELKYW